MSARTMRARVTDATVAEVAAALAGGQRYLVTSHAGPDGDAVGCMVASLLALERLGRESVGWNSDPVPGRFRFLAGAERITREPPQGDFDVTLIVDCSDPSLFDEPLPAAPRLGRVVVVDHHLTRGFGSSRPRRRCGKTESLGDVVLRDPAAASVGVLLYKVFAAMGVAIDREIAEALYCSLLSDTGSFRYQNTNPEAMLIAAALLGTGVDPWRVASHLYEARPRRELELLARVLGTLDVSPCGRAAALTVTQEMLGETGCLEDATDGLVNYARGVEGVEVAALFRRDDGGVRVSLRSRGSVDVSRIALRFGGGGHRNAAGFASQLPLGELRAQLFREVERAIDGD